MGFHLAAFNLNSAISAALQATSLAFDEHLTPNSQGAALLPYDADVLAMYGISVTMTRLQLNAPSLRRVIYPEINPVQNGTTIPALPALTLFGEHTMPRVRQAEAVQPFIVTAAAGAELQRVFVWFRQSFEPSPPGIVFPFRFTSVITGVTDAWAGGTLTPVDTLPFGRYAVVGMMVQGANILAARLVPPNSGPRPGVLGCNAIGNNDWNWFRSGRQGKFLEFVSTAVPLLQIYCSGASAAQTAWLDLIKLSDMGTQ